MSNSYVNTFMQRKLGGKLPTSSEGTAAKAKIKRYTRPPSFHQPFLTKKVVEDAIYNSSGGLPPPVITPDQFPTYVDPLQITITGIAGATIYFTTDGSDPTIASAPYLGPFLLAGGGTNTVKAIQAVGTNVSAIATIVVPQAVATPSISPATGSYIGGQSVTITCPVVGALITYTINAGPPQLYVGAFTVSVTSTIVATAVALGYATGTDTHVLTIIPANIYFGCSASVVLTDAEIVALSNNSSATDPSGSYAFAANPVPPGRYWYFCWKDSLVRQPRSDVGFVLGGMPMLGDFESLPPYVNIDPSDGSSVPWTYDLVAVSGTNYRVYRTLFPQMGAGTVVVTAS